MVKNFRFFYCCSIQRSWKQASNIPMRDLSQHHHHKASPGEILNPEISGGPAANGMGPMVETHIPGICDWKLETTNLTSQPLVEKGFGSHWYMANYFVGSWQLHLKYLCTTPPPQKNDHSSLQQTHQKTAEKIGFQKFRETQKLCPIHPLKGVSFPSLPSLPISTSVWESLRGSSWESLRGSSSGSSCGFWLVDGPGMPQG